MEPSNKKKNKHSVKSSHPRPKSAKANTSQFWKVYSFFRSNFVLTSLVVVLFGAFVLKYYEDVHFSYSNFKKTDVNIYSVLEVSKDAKDSDIKAKYRELSLKWHPDKNKDCPECEERFLKIKEAYKIIMNPSLREMYDKTKGHTVDMIPSKTTSLNLTNYDKLVKNSNKVWVVQVYSDDNSRCRSFAPLWDEFATKFEKYAKFGRVNVLLDEKLLSKLPTKPQLYPTLFLLFPERRYDLVPMTAMENLKKLSRYFYDNYPFYGTKLDDYSKFRHLEGDRLLFYSEKKHLPFAVKFLALKFHKVLKVYFVSSGEHYFKDELLLDDMKRALHLPKVPEKLELYDLCVALFKDEKLRYMSFQLSSKFPVLQRTLYSLFSLEVPVLSAHTYEVLCSRYSSKDRFCLVLPEKYQLGDLTDVYNKYENFGMLLNKELGEKTGVVDEETENKNKTEERSVSLVDLQFLRVGPNTTKHFLKLFNNFYDNTGKNTVKKEDKVLMLNKNKQLYTVLDLKKLNDEFVNDLLSSEVALKWVELPNYCKGDLFKKNCLHHKREFFLNKLLTFY